MTATLASSQVPLPAELRSPRGLTELVRGNDRGLIDEFSPVVRDRCIALDFAAVERIDAAGIAALICLYRAAQECGHSFAITNVSARVRELLTLVGLDHILLSGQSPCSGGAGASDFEHAWHAA